MQLHKQNLNYPLFECSSTGHQNINNHSIPLFSLYTSHPERYPVHLHWDVHDFQSANRAYQQQLEDALNQVEDLLLSGEDIASLEADELQRLVGDLRSSGRELVIFACVRSPYAFHCSQVQQQVKDGVAMNPVGLCPQRHRISKLREVFGESVQWIPFAEACRHAQGPVGAFLDFCGIDPTTITIHNSNEGRCAELVRIQNLLNHQEPRILDNALNPKHIRLRPFKGNRFLLQPKELAEVTDHLNTENSALEELLGPGFGDPERPTSDRSFASTFPALTYSLTALIGLLLQQQTAPSRTHLSLQDVQHFLLEVCNEADLRRALSQNPTELTQPLLEPKTTTADTFPEFLIPMAHQFIKRL
ncbi:hypothetical protein SynRS9915_00490 [Synechococcus sp. RS9915]|nr:hypothetical protein SynRS9915_00490 [Synechococcus sp. RS9915]